MIVQLPVPFKADQKLKDASSTLTDMGGPLQEACFQGLTTPGKEIFPNVRSIGPDKIHPIVVKELADVTKDPSHLSTQ